MEEIQLAKVLFPETVCLDVESFEDKQDMFDYLSDRFLKANVITSKEKYIEALYEREQLGSTYMGNHIALPHGKSDTVIQPGICFCRCKQSFTYQSSDEIGQVKLIFMLAIPQGQPAENYLQTLAALARLLMHEKFIEALYQIQDYQGLTTLISEYQM